MLVSVLEMLYVLCCGCSRLSCLSNVRSSAHTLLLALSFELHPVTTLSPVLQPWQLSHHIQCSKDTGYNRQSVSETSCNLYASCQYLTTILMCLWYGLKLELRLVAAMLPCNQYALMILYRRRIKVVLLSPL